MHGSAGHDPTQGQGSLPTLAAQRLPRRVRTLLQGVLDYAADELGRGLLLALDAYEHSLVSHADAAHSNDVRSSYLTALRVFRAGRQRLPAQFRRELEAALATVQSASSPTLPGTGGSGGGLTLSLVADTVIEENIVLNEVANRTEVRNSLPLFLLGQRFGVIAGRPAFEADRLPIGPYRLCEALRRASHELELSIEYRQLLFKQFDRLVMQNISTFYEAVNQYLVAQRVLPHLTFVPIRARPTVQNPAASMPAGSQPSASQLGIETVDHEPHAKAVPEPAAPPPSRSREALAEIARQLAAMPPPPQPATRWPGQAEGGNEAAAERQDIDMFELLRELMAGRRALVGKLGGRASANAATDRVAAGADLQRALSRLQAKPVATEARPGAVATLKQDLLAQLRQLSPQGDAQALTQQDDDAIDLVGLLFDHLGRELRPNNPTAPLLSQLQVPLLRVALGDKGFFSRAQHPARQILASIAEAGEFLNPQDEADRDMLGRLREVVERASREYNGDPALFASLLTELNQHLQAQARKAELAERRHVEAARGREKLEVARLQAAETLDRLLGGRRVPLFLRTLLGQAWSDVLALSLLRGGDQSETFRQQLKIAERLLDAAEIQRQTGQSPIASKEAHQLRDAIEAALLQVGYHADDAQAIGARLLLPDEIADDDPASSTELAMRLKQRVRFGQDADPAAAAAEPALSEAEQAQLDAILKLPFGSWFEFKNAQGVMERRRLSWFSTATGHCLFLNHRGQRVGECELPWLAREITRGNVRIVMQPPGSLVDRAWGAIVRALHSFAGRGKDTPS
jgi:hypothetical protein